ncbi:MAG: Asp-tRNA(Asn)/Glu-tRNA(Gln) amidotransferase subunit GatC [Oscillospiraceae bacterium]|nr:Asp-tRNA(Asn)/Glu-tRNA(Gln) amidotransferase subunit GatC [Oscillospiraceae bacterium]MBR6610184.1 Asp-tRNA(Asn)/Glu-tRNA(Gln) amidotransferase subunit GatC [Oscillospiraceae bacterium]
MEIDIMRLAKLAKLSIPEDKVEEFRSKMESIIQMVENLPDDLDTTGSLVDPDDTMELRKDEVQPSFPRNEMLQNAPYTAAGCILIPKVVD